MVECLPIMMVVRVQPPRFPTRPFFFTKLPANNPRWSSECFGRWKRVQTCRLFSWQ